MQNLCNSLLEVSPSSIKYRKKYVKSRQRRRRTEKFRQTLMTALLGDGNILFDDHESNGETPLTVESNVILSFMIINVTVLTCKYSLGETVADLTDLDSVGQFALSFDSQGQCVIKCGCHHTNSEY